MSFFRLKYGNHNGWVAVLGHTLDPKIDPDTGEEDFSDFRRVIANLQAWRPTQRWSPQPICLSFEERGQKLVRADRIFHTAVGPIFSENAVEKLRPILEKEGHVLPLEVINSEEKFFLWWVPVIKGSVNLERSDMFPNGKTVKKYALNEERLNGVTAFRPQFSGMFKPENQGRVLVSEDFVNAWTDAHLTGIEFAPI